MAQYLRVPVVLSETLTVTEQNNLICEHWSKVGDLLVELYSIVGRLEDLFPDRKFTPDGHLVGSIGEVVAAHMFGLSLLPPGAPVHDAVACDGRQVQIKFTQGNKRVGLRAKPDHLLVLRLTTERCIDVVYNGPGSAPWSEPGKIRSNGQKSISLHRLRELDFEVPEHKRLHRTVLNLTLGR